MWWNASPTASPSWITSSMQREMRSSPEITSFWRFALPFALFIAALGLLPHVLFCLNAGGLHYMEGAWDESTYTFYALTHDSVVYRSLGAWVFSHAIAALGLDGGLIVMDGLAPFVTAIIAAGIAHRIGFRTRASLFLASCLLLFALEFLALNSLIMAGPLTQLLPSASLFYPDWIRRFIPGVYENFFNLFKSPEPQITFIVQFAAFYLLLRHAQSLRVRYALLLVLLALSFPYIYISTGISLVLCMGLYAMALVLMRQHGGWQMLVCALLAAGYYACGFLGSPPLDPAGGFVFASRLPLFSISMMWAVALVWLYTKHWGQNLYTRAWLRECPAPVLLALVCCAVPCIALNQQLLTGRMVQGRAWEGYGNFGFIALALLILWPLVEVHVGPRMPHWLKRRQAYAATGLAVWLVLAQVANFVKYTRQNMDDLITAQLLVEQKAQHPKGLPHIILEASGEDSQVALRMGDRGQRFIAGAKQTFDHPIVPLSQGDERYMKSQAEQREQGFTYFDRLGVTQDQFALNITRESVKGMGRTEVAQFFAYMDCWKPLSDSRNMNIPGMQAKIPSIIADYGAFLKDKARRNHFGEVWLVTRKPHAMRDDAPWKETVLATKTMGMFMPTTVTIYQMTPR